MYRREVHFKMYIVALDLIFFFSFLFYMDCCADWHVVLVVWSH